MPLPGLRGSFTRTGEAGLNAVRFTGRLRRRTLAPGRYELELVARDATGNRSTPSRTRFRITRG
jgi:hypothetical protein